MVDTNSHAEALICGLTKVDPKAYGNWDGDCPGCDVDADVMALLCGEQGADVTKATNDQCTAANLTKLARGMWVTMASNDLFILYISGHGGQVRDLNGDEADGKDETLCLWDGEFTDDKMAALWESMPRGIRVLFITDTCNSGTNFKYRPKKLEKAVPRNFERQLIHIGGCPDGKSSMGSPSGGTLTTALIDAWVDGNTPREWCVRAKQLMPSTQVPQYEEYGNVTDAFRNGPALK